jgi:hypothetical protein
MGNRFKDLEALFDKTRSESRHGTSDAPQEKLSWRERDRRREMSSHTDQGRDLRDKKRPLDRYADAQAQKEQKAALSGLFEDAEGKKLSNAVENATDRAALQVALDAYFEKSGRFPLNPDFLERALDTRKDKMLRDIVAAIEEALPEADANRRKVLIRKMRSKARTTFDGPAAKHMKRLVEEYASDG